MVGNALGFRTVIVIPETQSQEKKDTLAPDGGGTGRSAGSSLQEPEQLRESTPRGWPKNSDRQLEANGAVWANQFDNTANRRAHYETTAVEIWKQTDGKVDGFSCAIGSGGTIGGVSDRLKEFNSDIKIALADPMGSALFNHYKHGELKAEGSSITEGIGQGRITANIDGVVIDDAFQIPDAEALTYAFDMLKDEGLCLGGSSGINVAGAVRLAQELGPGHTIATVLCDYGTRYHSKMFNPSFLREKGLPVPDWMEAEASVPVVFEEVESS